MLLSQGGVGKSLGGSDYLQKSFKFSSEAYVAVSGKSHLQCPISDHFGNIRKLFQGCFFTIAVLSLDPE